MSIDDNMYKLPIYFTYNKVDADRYFSRFSWDEFVESERKYFDKLLSEIKQERKL